MLATFFAADDGLLKLANPLGRVGFDVLIARASRRLA
jgi:hypothetical protein